MKHYLTLAFVTITMLCMAQPSLIEAENHFFDLNLKEAQKTYIDIYNHKETPPDQKVKAARKLAYINHHFYDNSILSKNYLTKALTLKTNSASIYADLIRLESQLNNFEKGTSIFIEAEKQNYPMDKFAKIENAMAELVLKEAKNQITNNQVINKQLLQQTLSRVTKYQFENSGILKNAKTQLGLAVFLNDGKNAKNAWHNYYHLPANQTASGLLTKPQQELRILFAKMETSTFHPNDYAAVVLNLAASRFYDLAYFYYLLNFKYVEKTPEINDIIAYYIYRKEIEKYASIYYKSQFLEKEKNTQNFNKSIEEIQKKLWQNLYWTSKKPKYSASKFLNEIYHRFGTKIYSGTFYNTNYYIGGHTILDTMATINQHGKKAYINYAILDNRFSNNYWGWFTGYMGFAGYGSNKIIVNYREPDASQALTYWNKLNNPDLFYKWKSKTIKYSQKDNQIVNNQINSTLHGIHNRIRIQHYSQIIDSLKKLGYSNDELCLKFISIFNHFILQSNLNHEGRHAIDFNILSRKELNNDLEMEYRAKLSQIYFSEFPLLDIGFEIDNTPHGQANKKILELFDNWISKNTENIPKFDSGKPALTQIELLSSVQIKTIIENADPLITH